jgi:outer membrane protein
LIVGIAAAADADNLSPSNKETILQQFPGAVITDTRQDTWQGQPVTEVEITTPDKTQYEVILSAGGEILDAQEEKGLPWIGGDLTIGIAARGEQEIYRDVDAEISPQPFLVYHNGPFHIVAYDSIDVGFDVYATDVVTLSLKGSLTLDTGYHPDDSDYLTGMDELETLYDAGLEVSTEFAGVEASLEALQDISGEHDGQQVELVFAYPWTAAGFVFKPEVSLTWMSADMVDYLYGVGVHEVRPNRAVYSPDASYEVSAGVLIRRPIFGNFSVIGLVEVATFGKEITDSPLVEEDYAIEGAIGIGYSF